MIAAALCVVCVVGMCLMMMRSRRRSAQSSAPNQAGEDH
jgi:hypothetical protein